MSKPKVPGHPPSTEQEPEHKNQGGRARGGTLPLSIWEKAEELYVRGGIERTKAGPQAKYPSLSEISRQTGISKASLSERSKKDNWDQRREEFRGKAGAALDDAVVEYRTKTKIKDLEIVDKFLEKATAAIVSGKMRADQFKAVDTAMRLKKLLTGEADRRVELHTSVPTLADLERMHSAYRAKRDREAGTDGVVTEGDEANDDFDSEEHARLLSGVVQDDETIKTASVH